MARRLIPDPSDLLTPNEASDLFGCSRATLYRWAREGRIGLYHFGHRARFSRSELQAQVGRGYAKVTVTS